MALERGVFLKKNRKFLLIYFGVLLFVTIGSVFASDVAYIYKINSKIDQNIVDVFSELKLETNFVKESDLATTDLSKYKFIFIGDENFKSAIPAEKYPIVIINSYITKKTGLTDSEGISRLVSASPLKVNANGNLIQVYTSSRDRNGIAIPYYFLDVNNKAPTLEKYAGTYSTSGGEYLGDVISVAKKGSELLNGKTVEGGICFFGIVKTKFWTNEAKQLFKDCIKTVYDYTVVPPVVFNCLTNSDCGTNGFTGSPFCQDNAVFQNFQTFSCNNPGTELSFCSSDNIPELVTNCSNGCDSGACLGFITCSSDSQCNDNNPNTNDVCLNSGTTSSSCAHNTIPVISGGGSSHSILKGIGSAGTCITKWSCGDWSECKDGKQTRICGYTPDWCKPLVEKPAESQNCSETISPPSSSLPSVENSQSIENSPEAIPSPTPTETTPTQNNNFPITGAAVAAAVNNSWVWVIVLIVIVAGILYWYFKRK